MMFPQAMLRLVWFVPETRLAQSLQLLVETKLFHLTAQRQLGEVQDLQPLKKNIDSNQLHSRHLAGQKLLQTFPENTLLNYKIVDNSELSSLPSGVILQSKQLVLWAGTSSEYEIEQIKKDTDSPKVIEISLTEDQYRLLCKTADQIGIVGQWSIIDGWIPATEKQRFCHLLAGEKFLLIPAEESGLSMSCVPSLFHRSKTLNGFASLMGLYGTTNYRELDPTLFLAIGFSFMFGMMFADLGQGLLLFVLGLGMTLFRLPFLDRKLATNIGWLLMPVGLSAAFFGLLFGSLFSHEDWIPAILFHPMDNVLMYLFFSVLIGVVLIMGGMLFGVFNAWRGWRMNELLWENFGPIGILFYASLILFVIGVIADALIARITGMFIVAGCLLTMAQYYFKSMQGESLGIRLLASFLESYDFIMKFIMQTFSFVRIAAFTFAHIALSSTLMIFVDMASNHPWLGILILAIGNLFIIIVEGVLVSIQAIRLHFFELFTKFISGEGIPFTPLSN